MVESYGKLCNLVGFFFIFITDSGWNSWCYVKSLRLFHNSAPNKWTKGSPHKRFHECGLHSSGQHSMSKNVSLKSETIHSVIIIQFVPNYGQSSYMAILPVINRLLQLLQLPFYCRLAVHHITDLRDGPLNLNNPRKEIVEFIKWMISEIKQQWKKKTSDMR